MHGLQLLQRCKNDIVCRIISYESEDSFPDWRQQADLMK